MTIYTNNDLLSLMGSCEMECAAARMLNLAREKGCRFPDLVVQEEDFDKNDANEHDGFFDLIGLGWLERYESSEKGYRPTMGFVARIRKRIPSA